MLQVNEFSYGGVESGRFFISCDTEIHSILPEQRQYGLVIPGMDGVHDFNIRSYETLVITKRVYFDGEYSFLRAHREEIMAWLANDGKYKKLIFGDKPDRYYYAKIVTAVEFTNTRNREIGTIQFVCNPPWQYSADGLALTPEYYALVNNAVEDNRFVLEIDNVPKVMKLYNVGQAVRPVIKLIGYAPNKAEFVFCDQSVSFIGESNIFDGFVIDCESETVRRMSDNENMYPLMNGDFITLPHGYSEIVFTRAGEGKYPLSLTAIVEFTPIYGG